MEAVAGKSDGHKLEWLPSAQMTWKVGRTKHPDTLVLSTETGHQRNDSQDPHRGYERVQHAMFLVSTHNKSLQSRNS
jgi:hypothetical protein